MKLLAVLALLLLGLGVLQKRRHAARLARIPLRVHVNGTRGKSGITRLIVAGLRAGGLCVVGKTTGTAARLLLQANDEWEEVPFRRTQLAGPANIGEQRRLVRLAVEQGANALVSECMAVHPEIQDASEREFLHATHTVITNVRQDHSDVMGDTLADVARTLSLTVPNNGELIVGPELAAMPEVEIFAAEAAARGSRLVQVSALSAEEQQQLPEDWFADNVATALTVCERAGVERTVALRGMFDVVSDPGEMKGLSAEFEGRTFRLVNAFAANDAASTLDIWRRFRSDAATGGRFFGSRLSIPVIGLCNNRADRGTRITELARDFAKPAVAEGLAGVLVLGEGLFTAQRLMRQAGVGVVRVPAVLRTPDVPEILRAAVAALEEQGTDTQQVVLFGFGNTKGVGNTVTDWFVEQYFEIWKSKREWA